MVNLISRFEKGICLNCGNSDSCKKEYKKNLDDVFDGILKHLETCDKIMENVNIEVYCKYFKKRKGNVEDDCEQISIFDCNTFEG